MSFYVSRCVLVTVVFFACTMLMGCGSTPSTRYYQLHAASAYDSGSDRTGDKAKTIVGVGPVEIPSYVDRTQMVIRVGETEVERLEFERWAEPLEQNLTRVLIENISQLLSSRGFTIVRWDDELSLDSRVRVEVTKFDMTITGDVSLLVRWILSGKDGQEPLAIRISRLSSSGIPGDYVSLVSEMSKHIESVSREIANALSDTF